MDLQIVSIASIHLPGVSIPIPQIEATILKDNENIVIYTGDSETEAKTLFSQYCALLPISDYPHNILPIKTGKGLDTGRSL